jgi:hypothetical protein
MHRGQMLRFSYVLHADGKIEMKNTRVVETCEGVARVMEWPRLEDFCCEDCHKEEQQRHARTVFLRTGQECFVCCQMATVLSLLGWISPQLKSKDEEKDSPTTDSPIGA